MNTSIIAIVLAVLLGASIIGFFDNSLQPIGNAAFQYR